MKILITNDDGYDAEGIRLLTTWARHRFPDAYILLVAPLTQQSAKSHSVNIHSSFVVKELSYEGADKAFAIDSTPADCVRFASWMEKPLDLVFSGVNRGYNMGFDIGYSGTCAAVFEADYLKIKGVAFSTDFPSFDAARSHMDRVWDYFEEKKLLEKGNVWNVNIPLEPDGGIRLTTQGREYYQDYFVSPDGINYHAEGSPSNEMLDPEANPLDDTVAIVRDHQISIMPFLSRNVDEALLEKLRNE